MPYLACWFTASANVGQILLQIFSHLKVKLAPCLVLVCFFISYFCFLFTFLLLIQQAQLFRHCLKWKYTRHSLVVSFFSLEALVIPFSVSFSLRKRKPNFFSCFNTCKYISRTLLYAFQPLKNSILQRIFAAINISGILFRACFIVYILFFLFICISITNCRSHTYFVVV